MAHEDATGLAATKLSGRRLGEWVVGAPIGSGGFADVFSARQPQLERDAVIKVLRHPDGNTPQVEAFKREALIASQLDHPYAAHVYSFGVETDGLMWIAMELVRGKSLAELINETGPMPVARFVPLFERLCEVVHSAHEVGLIHRDIKPANVMVVTRAGRLLPKLVDFGIAEFTGKPTAPPSLGNAVVAVAQHDLEADTDGWGSPDTIVAPTIDALGPTVAADGLGAPKPTIVSAALRAGTPAYMAPEQWFANSNPDHRADIYSLGVLAHQCLTGELPFRGSSVVSFLQSDEPPPRLGDEFPGALAQVVQRSLARSPTERFASALEFGRAVRAATRVLEPPRLSRAEATPWLLSAPKHLGDALAMFEIEKGRESSEALGHFLLLLSQWIAVLAMAACASKGPRVVAAVAALREQRQSVRDWLELAAAICRPYREQPEDFPIPELVSWLTKDDSPIEYLLTLASMCSTSSTEKQPTAEKQPTQTTVGLLRSLLSSLRFICDYSLADRELSLRDGEGVELFSLAPLALYEKPTRGAEPELFIVAGSQGQMLMTSPRGFELGSPHVEPWLEHYFCIGSARPLFAEETAAGPYRGLATFSPEHASLFFGRNRDVQKLFNRLMAQSFVALTGPSGSGKSSLVSAGLIPRMPSSWSIVSLQPGNAPLLALSAALGELPCAVGELGRDIERIPDWLATVGRKLLITIDQAEELLTLASPSDAQTLATLVVGLLRSPRVRVLLTIRDDFLAAAASIEPWREMLSTGVLLVGTPSREELFNMLVGPAERVGYQFDDPLLATEMVDEVASEAVALPLISFAASQLWTQRDPKRRLLLRAAHQRMGGVAGALAGYAESVFAALPTARQSQVRSLFRRLVTREGTRAVLRASELATTPAERQIVEHLVAARLLVAAEGADGFETIMVIHEALLTRWPRLARWRIEDVEAVRFRTELRAASITWHERQNDPSYLWSGAALRNLDEFVANSGENLSPSEGAFARASHLAQSRRGRLRRIGALSAFGVLTAALVAVLVLNRSVEANRDRAENRLTEMLASRGLTELTAHRSLRSLPYLQAAYERGDDSLGIRLGLELAQSALPKVRAAVTAHEGSVRFLGSPTQDFFLTHNRGEMPRLWHWSGSSFEAVASFDHQDTLLAAITPGGKQIVTASSLVVNFWEPSGELIAKVEQKAHCGALGVPPNGRSIAVGDGDSIVIWDLKGNRIAKLGEQKFAAIIVGMTFSRDGAQLAAARSDNKVFIWDYINRTLIREIDIDAAPTSLNFVGEGEALLVAHVDGSVTRIDTQQGTVIQRQIGERVAIQLQCQTDDRCLAFSTTAKLLSIIDATTLAPVTMIAATSNRIQGQQSEDGQLLVGQDGQRVRVFEGNSYHEVSSQDVGEPMTAALISSDNKTLVIGSADGTLKALDITTRDAQTIFEGHDSQRGGRDGTHNQLWNAQFMPDNDLIASFDNYDLFLWEADSGTIVKRIALDGGTPVGRPRLTVGPKGREILLPDRRQADVIDVESGLRIAKFSDDNLASAMSRTDEHIITGTQENRSKKFFMTAWGRRSEELVAERETSSMVLALEGGEPGVVYYCLDSEIGRWDFLGETSWKRPLETTGYLAVSGDQRFVSASTLDGKIYVWNAQTGELHRRFRAPTESTLAIALGPQGRLLATGALDLGLYLWDINKGVTIARLTGHNSTLRSIDISSDGSQMVSVDNAWRVLVWKLNYERRSPAEISEIITDKLPFKLDGVELVPNTEPN